MAFNTDNNILVNDNKPPVLLMHVYVFKCEFVIKQICF